LRVSPDTDPSRRDRSVSVPAESAAETATVNHDMDEIVEPNTPTMPSKPFESPCAEYSFMVVPIDSSFSESPEFLTKIQHMIYSASSFSGCLEFVSESNVPPLLDMCPPRHPTYLILPSLGVMPRVPTALHLHVAQIDEITRSIETCNDTYKFVAYLYSILQEFAVDSKVMVTNHPETVKKLNAWCTDFDKILKRSISIAYKLQAPWDPGISSIFSRDNAPPFTICTLIKRPSSTVDTSWRPAPPPPWSRRGVPVLLSRPLP